MWVLSERFPVVLPRPVPNSRHRIKWPTGVQGGRSGAAQFSVRRVRFLYLPFKNHPNLKGSRSPILCNTAVGQGIRGIRMRIEPRQFGQRWHFAASPPGRRGPQRSPHRSGCPQLPGPAPTWPAAGLGLVAGSWLETSLAPFPTFLAVSCSGESFSRFSLCRGAGRRGDGGGTAFVTGTQP